MLAVEIILTEKQLAAFACGTIRRMMQRVNTKLAAYHSPTGSAELSSNMHREVLFYFAN